MTEPSFAYAVCTHTERMHCTCRKHEVESIPMSEPQTQAGKALHDWITHSVVTTRRPERQRQVLAIEAEAAAAERERLRALYMETEAGRFCNTDVWHVHNHEMCNARCWCSWADPDNCPYPNPEPKDGPQE